MGGGGVRLFRRRVEAVGIQALVDRGLDGVGGELLRDVQEVQALEEGEVDIVDDPGDIAPFKYLAQVA